MNNLNDEKWNIINEIVAYIYTAEPHPDFDTLTEKIGALFHFSNSLSCMASDVDDGITFFDFRSPRIPQNHLDDYCTHFIHYDFLQWYSATPLPTVCRATDVIVEKHMASSVFMKQWLSPINIYYALLVNIAANNHLYANIVFYRSKEEGDFSDQDINAISIINRHLCACFKHKYPKGIYFNPKKRYAETLQNKFGLSNKEHEIIHLISQGTPRKKLCEELFIGNNTLKNYLSSIYKKMDVSSYSELIDLLLSRQDIPIHIKNIPQKSKDNQI